MLAVLVVFVCLCRLIGADAPPRAPPESLIDGYTRNGLIPLEYFYVDDTMSGNSTHFSYSSKDIELYIEGARKLMRKFDSFLDRVPKGKGNADLTTETANEIIRSIHKQQWIQFSLYVRKELVVGNKVGVIGSMEPWLETFLLALGAAQVVTIEYNYLTYAHPNIETVSKDHFDALYDPDGAYHQTFDLLVAPSALDHDGLGRYGDPLNPDADLQSMDRLKRLVKPMSGVLVLSVPIGPDVVVFNLHRRYGRVRLPLLLSGWDRDTVLGWDEARLDQPANWRQTYEPVWFLKPSSVDFMNAQDQQNSVRGEDRADLL